MSQYGKLAPRHLDAGNMRRIHLAELIRSELPYCRNDLGGPANVLFLRHTARSSEGSGGSSVVLRHCVLIDKSMREKISRPQLSSWASISP